MLTLTLPCSSYHHCGCIQLHRADGIAVDPSVMSPHWFGTNQSNSMVISFRIIKMNWWSSCWSLVIYPFNFCTVCIALNRYTAAYPFDNQNVCSLCSPSSLFLTHHHSVCTGLEIWMSYDCVSLFLDMFDSMPEQSPTTESKAATTPSVDLFGAGTGVDIHFSVCGTSSSLLVSIPPLLCQLFFSPHVLVCPP